jgi:HlyD family secretion protein
LRAPETPLPRLPKPFLLIAGAVAVAAVAFFLVRGLGGSTPRLDVETVEVARGDVRRIVSTSGAVRANVTVDVGSQLSGQIQALEADYNSQVSQGDVIARLDPQTYETRVREAEATLIVAQSQVEVQRANVSRAEANLKAVQAEYDRTNALRQRGTASEAAYDTALASVESSRADVAVAEAGLVNAEATLGQRQAALDSARIDLERTVIRSPIDGVVVSRAVNVGQTVAASMQAPILFTIAEDLTRVQIDAQVDEADIGQVENGQPVSFTVDAFPDTRFRGVVDQIRLAALTQTNVVTYTVVISAENPGRRLLPGMTANVDIVTGARQGVITVDNRALRFEPRGAADTLLTAEGREAMAATRQSGSGPPAGGPPGGFAGGGGQGAGGGFGGGMVDQLKTRLELSDDQVERIQTSMRASFASLQTGGAPDRDAMRTRIRSSVESVLTPDQLARYQEMQSELDPSAQRVTVWVQNADGQLEPRRIVVGVSDATVAEVMGDALKEGDRVVVRVRERAS